MKYIALILSLLFTSGAWAAGGFGAKKISRQSLITILNHAKVEELSQLSRMKLAQLHYRLFKIPIEGKCIPNLTVICAYHYYLAVRELQTGDRSTVYDLGQHGEITDFSIAKTLTTNRQATDVVYFNILSYPRLLKKQNPKLKQKQTLYGGDVSVRSFGITSVVN